MTDDTNAGAPATTPESAPPPQAADTAQPAPTMRDTMMRAIAKIPERGEHGKFTPRNVPDTTAEAAPESEAAPAEPETPDQPETQASETAEPSIEPPASWSADVKAKWNALPRDVQEFLARREGDVHKAITQAGERIKSYQDVEKVLAPRRQVLAAEFGSEANALQQLFALSDFAGRDPAGFVQWFSQRHGIDLTALSNAPVADAQPRADPQVAALQKQLQAVTGYLTQREQAAHAAEIDSFATAKDEKGALRHPFFADVREEMGKLLAAGIVQTLDEAYAKAIRTNDAVWSKVQAQREAEREAKRKAEAERAAKEAKRVASTNVRGTGTVSGSPAKGQTMRQTMEAVARRMQGAA